jgi:acetyltransferase-like isoleucine patch superfamily enzyme
VSAMGSPDRPLPSILVPIRTFVRRVRLWRLRAMNKGKLEFGNNVTFGPRARLLVPNYARFADDVSVGADFHLESNLEVADGVLISSSVAIVGNDHQTDDPELTVYRAARLPASEVRLEGDNLLGFGVIVVGSVTIGRGAIVGAGAVVVRDLPPETICVGVPARPIGPRKRSGRVNPATQSFE